MRIGQRIAVCATATILAVGVAVVTAPSAALAYGYHYDYHVAETILRADDVFQYVNTHFTSTFSAVSSSHTTCPDHLEVGNECDLVGFGGNIRVEEVGSRHFVFRSRPGHAEGANKVINFTFYNEGDQVRLSVTASGKNNWWQSVPGGNRLNRLNVQNLWSNFAARVGNVIRAGYINQA